MPRILFVSGFHHSTRARDLAHTFEKYGRLVRCDVPAPKSHASTAYAFVEFKSERAADDAYHAMHGQDFDGHRLSVQWAKNPPSSMWRNDRRNLDRPRSRSRSPRRDRDEDRRRRHSRSRERDYRDARDHRDSRDTRDTRESRDRDRDYDRSYRRRSRSRSPRDDRDDRRRPRSPSPVRRRTPPREEEPRRHHNSRPLTPPYDR
ncbi:hypothetical protein FRC02_010458 [Tulasnella sp. 418]|nr:hypothetical protein FRC02_010458 [Tulasnella sp. 418]